LALGRWEGHEVGGNGLARGFTVCTCHTDIMSVVKLGGRSVVQKYDTHWGENREG
jgi:hypothetical protein